MDGWTGYWFLSTSPVCYWYVPLNYILTHPFSALTLWGGCKEGNGRWPVKNLAFPKVLVWSSQTRPNLERSPANSNISANFPSVLWHCWLGDRKGIRPVKSCMLVCWWWRSDWSFARVIAPVVTTPYLDSIILSSNKIQNGDILVPVDPGSPGNTKTEKERERVCY